MSEHERALLVDASAFITLAEIDRVQLLNGLAGTIYMPDAVAAEIEPEPSKSIIEGQKRWLTAANTEWVNLVKTHRDSERAFDYTRTPEVTRDQFRKAANHLGEGTSTDSMSGDVALLGIAFGWQDAKSPSEIVIVTDDKPLRKTCKALGVPLSGSIGVVIAAVERGDLQPDEAKDALVAMDEVGARLSARLLRKAERLIDEAADRVEE